jgi:hypothetical protein
MAIIVAKAEKRAADGGKQTVFFHHGSQVEAEKIERFKKRKISKDLVASPNAGKSKSPRAMPHMLTSWKTHPATFATIHQEQKQ